MPPLAWPIASGSWQPRFGDGAQCQRGKESMANSHPPFSPCSAARLGRDCLFLEQMRRKRIVRFIVAGGLLGAIVLAFVLQQPGSPPAIAFLGYKTNVQGWSRMAVFGFTNQSRARILRWGAFNPEFRTGARQPWATINFGSAVVLGPGQSEVVLVPIDTNLIFTNQGAWRAVFFWRQENA